jgi:hypothetical protein
MDTDYLSPDTEEIPIVGNLIRVAFFKGDTKVLHHRFIRWWTGSIYSHAELLLDEDTWVSISPFIYSKVGTRIKTNYNKSDWDFIHFSISDVQFHALKDFVSETTGDGYDWIGMLLSQMGPFMLKRRERWYCSQWVFSALNYSGIFKLRSSKIYETPGLNPGKLFDLLVIEKDIF